MDKPARGQTLFLIDTMYLVFRAFHAPTETSFSSPKGVPTQATYIFVRTLRKLLRDYSPDYVAVAFDLAVPTFRDQIFEKYKANRPAFPEELSVQLPYVRRFCQALGVPIVEKAGFEADDVIGTLAREGHEKGTSVYIVSSDKDLLQLVGDGVYVVKIPRMAGDPETLVVSEKDRTPSNLPSRLNVKTVEDIAGVKPSQIVDWLALTGDTVDNIPGARPLPGHEPQLTEGEKKRTYIGPDGAAKLLREFGTLENALGNYEKASKASYREALRDFRNEALLSKELATVRTDVPLHTGLEQLKPAQTDLGELTTLCQELGFSSLLREFLEEAPRPAEAAPDAVELSTPTAIASWLRALEAREPVALGFAVEGDEGFAGRLAGLGFSDGKRLAIVQLGAPGLLEAAKPFFADPAVPKAVHNSKLLGMLLGKEHIELGGVADDTMLYSYLLDPLASSHALADTVLRRMGRKVSASLAEAAERTRELATLFLPEIVREGLKQLYEDIELPLASVLAEMEAVGVRIDPEILATMSGEFERELTGLTREIHDLAGEAFDIDSPRQLGEILFEKLKLPGGKRLKKSGQYSTEASVLESLAERHELPRKIIEYRTRAKLKSTYVDALPKYINPRTGRLHTSFNQTVARTGRLSSSNPNLQNIPIDDEFGLRIRSAFVAEPGWRLISADYSQIELRILAHMSEDARLIEAFSRNEDIHSRTAQEIFGVLPALQTHEHRRMAKAINYGVIYGLSSFGLAARTGTRKTEAQQYIDEYFKRYRGVKEFLDRIVEEARTSSRVRTLFGRLRPIPEINSRDVPSRNRAEREAMNTPLQGTAADLMKLAMVKVDSRLRREKMQTRMILTVHDELVFESPGTEVEAAQGIVKAEMEGAFAMKVPLRVDVGVGKNWKEAK